MIFVASVSYVRCQLGRGIVIVVEGHSETHLVQTTSQAIQETVPKVYDLPYNGTENSKHSDDVGFLFD
jgi:hypothetical protein